MINNYFYIHALHNDIVISSELILYGKEDCYSFLGGTNSEYFHLRPNDYLKYETIKYSKEIGLRRYVLGGGYGEDDGIYLYKKSFAPNGIKKFCIGKRVFNDNIFNDLIAIRDKIVKTSNKCNFFPQYRA